MTYVDGFLVPVPADKIEDYRALSAQAGEVWKEYGALSYMEAVLDDDAPEMMTSFKKTAALKEGEVAIFSFITYKDKASRDEINAKVMADPRLKCDPNNMPFDVARMSYGGFSSIVSY